MGSYNLYEYSFGNVLPDYPKLGVWTDAYYVTFNMFTNGASFAGGRACAYDRAAMIAGAASPVSICFNSTSRFSFLPSDLDGTVLPPAGSCFTQFIAAVASVSAHAPSTAVIAPLRFCVPETL